MDDFAKDFMKDIARGDTKRYLRQQKTPQACWTPVETVLESVALRYDPRHPGKKVLIGALGDVLLGVEDDRHMGTIAGSRSGKSVGLMSNLFFYRGSALVMDFKGELRDKTARHREAMGQRVYAVDPFGTGGTDTERMNASYNPMDVLDIGSATFLEDASLVAESMVIQAVDAKDPHWDESARNFIEGVIVHVATDPLYSGKRNLIEVRSLLKVALRKEPGTPKEAKPQLFYEMLRNASRLAEDADIAYVGAALEGAAEDFYSKGANELSGVQSMVQRHTKFLDYKGFQDVMKRSDFSLRDLKAAPEGMTIYLCFPATRAEISKRWMRIFINQMMDAMEREPAKPKAPVLVCLDEFPVLGYMRQLETAAGLMASYDVKLWFFLQDLGQLKAIYKERWETFIANTGVMQFFGNTDLTTTKYISERLGKTPVEVARLGEVARDQQEKGLSGRSESVELHDLLTPDEVARQFARDDRLSRQLVLLAGKRPMILQRAIYYDVNGPVRRFLT